MNRLIDIGVNLTHDSFDSDRDEIISRAADAGVERLIVTGANVSGSIQAIALADQYPGQIFATAGVHPHHASEYTSEVGDRLLSFSRLGAVVAVGECGLDFFRTFSPREAQLAAFRSQLEIAVEAQKPVFLHQRDAHTEFVDILEEYRSDLTGGVAHCFTGGRAELQRYLELGLHVGITGWICDERRGAQLREAVGAIPMNRLLLETDAPYLLPRDIENKPAARRNEPALLPHILLRLASEMGRDPDLVAAASTENAERLFSLTKTGPSPSSGGSSG
jgi:TatD DNase family protein